MRPCRQSARAVVRVAACVFASLATSSVEAAAQPAMGEVTSQIPDQQFLAKGSVALFDYQHTWHATELEGGPMWWRKDGTNDTGDGWELSFGAVTESRVSQFFVAGLVRTQFRYFDSKSVALSPLQNMALVGASLGPLEPEARVGFSLLTFDVFHGAYSFEMFSPRVEAGLGIRVGHFRIAAHGFSEMLWRWWGSNYFEKGIAFDVRFEAAKRTNPLIE